MERERTNEKVCQRSGKVGERERPLTGVSNDPNEVDFANERVLVQGVSKEAEEVSG